MVLSLGDYYLAMRELRELKEYAARTGDDIDALIRVSPEVRALLIHESTTNREYASIVQWHLAYRDAMLAALHEDDPLHGSKTS